MSRLAAPCKVVPNVVPMIDIVSQLVIFFMLATQFISADVDTLVKLPDLADSQAQKDLDTNKLFLNVRVHQAGGGDSAVDTAKGDIVCGGLGISDQAQREGKDWSVVLTGVLNEYDKKSAKLNLNRVVVIRADKRLQWEFIFGVMNVITRYNQDKLNKARDDAKARGQEFKMETVPMLDLRLCGPLGSNG